MLCWKCGEKVADPEWGKISFRAECTSCGAALHCCKNCVYYKPGLPNDCAVPGTEFIRDRQSMNLCEDFKVLEKGPTKAQEVQDISKRLFGEDLPPPPKDPKDKFNNLF